MKSIQPSIMYDVQYRRLYISILGINEKKIKKKKLVGRKLVTTWAWPPVKEEKS